MKRIIPAILVLLLVLSLSAPAYAAGGRQHTYSTSANSGIRHEVCTSLLGTRADSYYTGSYTYEKLSALEGNALLSSLRTLTVSRHTKTTSYDDCHYKAVRTDCENGDGTSISLLYTSYTATEADWVNNKSNGWNREHVWPKSLGGFKTSGPGADLHHLRPADVRVNSTRGNKKYGNVSGGSKATAGISSGLSGGTYAGNYFEPLDNAKGDVARIILYMYVRYGGESGYTCSSVTNVFQSVDVLLEWCALDPVDTWEMGRNEVVASIQGNRNVFIDYPELAWQLFNKTAPANMTTPSGGAGSSDPTPTVCPHSSSKLVNASAATCTSDGYTGDTVCADCGHVLQQGTRISATGHTNANGDQKCDICGASITCRHSSTAIRGAKAATCTSEGYTGDECCTQCGTILKTGSPTPTTRHTPTLANVRHESCRDPGYTGDTVCADCGAVLEYGELIPIMEHRFGDWQTTEGGKKRTCSQCGITETESTQTEPETPSTAPTEPETSVPTTEATAPATQATEATAPETAATLPETEPTQATAATDSTPPDPDDNGSDYILIIVIVIAACAAGIIAFFLVGKRTKHEQ